MSIYSFILPAFLPFIHLYILFTPFF
jgi:hypothetical protein